MPGDNVFHDAVERGLIKEGWTITAVPYFVPFGGVDQYIDIAAERPIGTAREDQRIAFDSLFALVFARTSVQLHGVDLIV